MRPRTSRLMRASPRTSADAAEQEHRRFDAALHRACARRRSRRRRCCRGRRARRRWLAQVLERRLHRRHRLAAGVLHQHDRRDADVVDRPAIGLAHLLSVEHAHPKSSVLLVLDCGQLRHGVHENRIHGVAADAMRGAVYVNGTIAPADRRRRSRSTITGSSTARASTRRCAPTTACRSSTIATCAGCAHSARAPRTSTCRSTTTTLLAGGLRARRSPRPRRSTGEAYIRVLLTRGVGELTYDSGRRRRRRSSSSSSRSRSRRRASTHEGIRISLVPILRNHPGSVNPIIKSNNLLNNALAMQEAYRRGAEEGADVQLPRRAVRVLAVELLHRPRRRRR